MRAIQSSNCGHILIVDDQNNWRETIAELLREDGHQVQTVSNITEAKETFVKYEFDVVILDVRLVDRDRHDVQGLEMLQHLRMANGRVCVIALTGYPTPEIEAKTRELGAQTIMFKSPPEGLDINRFRETIRDLVEKTSEAGI